MIKNARRPEGDGLKGREAVTTMATTFLGWRPSTLAAACAPSAPAAVAQAYALGQPAVAIQVPVTQDLYAFAGENRAGSGFKVRTAPIFGHAAVAGATKINNYMGTIAAAAAEGATESSLIPMNAAVVRVQKVQGDKVKGGDARGNPPRGRPV
jgi:hypothetical protein